MIFNFCRLKNVASWGFSAIDVEFWRSNLRKLFGVLQALMYIGSYFNFFPVPETGCPLGHTGWTWTLTLTFLRKTALGVEIKKKIGQIRRVY